LETREIETQTLGDLETREIETQTLVDLETWRPLGDLQRLGDLKIEDVEIWRLGSFLETCSFIYK
jgi:hypothetical protein